VDVDGDRAWVIAGDTTTPAEPPTGVRLLPDFDAFVIAGQPREKLFPGEAATRAMANGGVGNYPVVLVDGVVGGVWHARRAGRNVEITVESLRRLTRSQERGLDAEVELVGRVLEAVPSLTVGRVTVGAHA
jgi:hypothetical protein